MRRTVRHAAGVTLACLAALAAPVAAHADAFDQVFAQYQRTGKIDGCKFSAAQLEQAKAEVPNDIEQYAPDFPDALDAAAAQRAKGACAKKPAPSQATATTPAAGTTTATTGAGSAPAGTTTPAPVVTAPATTTPQPQPDPQPAPAAADDAIPAAATSAQHDSGGAGAGVVLLAVAVGLLLLGLALWGAARWWAYEPPWLVRWRHAAAEAGWRAGNAWAEFTDWLRLGR